MTRHSTPSAQPRPARSSTLRAGATTTTSGTASTSSAPRRPNARRAERAGAAVVVPDEELDGPRLAREVAALLGAPQRLAEMANAAAAAARPDAAERIADELLRLAGGADT